MTTTKAPVITTPDTGAVWPKNRLTNLVPKPSGTFSVFSHDFNDSQGEAVVVLKDISNQQALDYVKALKNAGFNNVNEELKPFGTLTSFKASNNKGVTVEFWRALDTYTLEINDN